LEQIGAVRPEELLTANDVARILQVNVSHVYVLKQRGLKSVRLGKKAVRYRKKDIEQFVAENVVER
jgi:predicted DNA-binding transcriptional regulator AlpA